MKCPRSLLLALLILVQGSQVQAGTPLDTYAYVAELQTENVYRVHLEWDGNASLLVSTPELIATAGAGGGMVAAEYFLYVAGSGVVSRIDLRNNQVALAQTFNNANACAPDLSGAFLYCGWRSALSQIPTMPFGNGSAVVLGGDDVNLTDVVFTPGGESFYSTGTEAFNGDFGRLDLDMGQTSRLQSAAFATGLGWDDFSQKILIAGLGRARLVDPATPAAIASQRDDSANENYLSLSPDGRGHAIGTRCCIAGASLVLIDYSETGDLSSAQTLIASAPLTNLTFVSGEAIFVDDRIFHSQFEEGEP
jgi:hypothetical protein